MTTPARRTADDDEHREIWAGVTVGDVRRAQAGSRPEPEPETAPEPEPAPEWEENELRAAWGDR